MKDCKDVRIDSFVFRRGIINALEEAGIVTIGDVIKHREDFILNVLFSKDDFEHLKNSLRPYNEQMRGYKIEDEETQIKKGMFSDSVYRALKDGGIYTIEDMLLAGSKGLSVLHKIGRVEIAEIKTNLIQMGYLDDEKKSSDNEK